MGLVGFAPTYYAIPILPVYQYDILLRLIYARPSLTPVRCGTYNSRTRRCARLACYSLLPSLLFSLALNRCFRVQLATLRYR
jgi:hypothetical protein